MSSRYSQYYDRWHAVIKKREERLTPSSELWELRRIIIGEYLKRYSEASYVLDLGCGTSDYLRYFSTDTQVIGMDISFEAIKTCRVNARPGAKFVVGEAEAVPFKDRCIDLVIMDEVLEHIENVDKALKDIQRIIQSGGRIIISTPNRYRYIAILKRILPERVIHYFSQFRNGRYPTSELEKEDKILAGYRIPTHHQEFSSRDLRFYLKRNGFVVQEVKGITCHLPPPIIYNYLAVRFPAWHRFWKKIDLSFTRPLLFLKSNLIMVAHKNEKIY